MSDGSRRIVEAHRQCPTCYHGPLNGIGNAYNTQAPTTYYKCDRCGHTWSAVIRRIVTTTHREVEMQQREQTPANAPAKPSKRKDATK